MNNYSRGGIAALLVLGSYYLWRNRFGVQRFLESKGINTPFDTSSISSSIRSGIAKVTGRAEGSAASLDQDTRQVG